MNNVALRRGCLLLAVLLLVGACAHPHTFEEDKLDPNYHNGNYANQLPLPIGKDFDGGFQPGSGVAALVLAGIDLATNPDYYHKIAITGRCLYRPAGVDSIEMPCINVDVVLRDASGKELSRAQVNNGEFAFRVLPHTAYRIEAQAPKLKMESAPARTLYQGDDIILHMVRLKR